MATFIFDGDVAEDVGVNAAVIYWNIEWWVRHNAANGTNFHDGKYWTYNSRKAFSELFGFMSSDAIERALKKLKDKGYIEVGEFNDSPYDRTRWYTVCDTRLCENAHSTLCENAHSHYLYTDVNTDENYIERAKTPASEEIPYKEIVSYLNERAGTSYRPSSKKTRSLIHARWQEGFRLEDFRKAIDSRCAEWIHDPRMARFIRPETIFGTKFESYLQTPGGRPEVDFSVYDHAGEVLDG